MRPCRPEHGAFRIFAYGNLLDQETHVALVRGDIGDGRDVLVRVHSKCLTGDVFHSARCDCGPSSTPRWIGLPRKAEAYCST
jgi:GTP cyclohydrolase II